MIEQIIRYMEEKAKGGWGLIITEDYAVQEHGKGYFGIPGLWKDEQIERLEEAYGYDSPVRFEDLLPDVSSGQTDDDASSAEHDTCRSVCDGGIR